jgi:hypothetical protein
MLGEPLLSEMIIRGILKAIDGGVAHLIDGRTTHGKGIRGRESIST